MKQKWNFDLRAQQNLQRFMEIVSPSTNEVLMANFLRERWAKLGLEIETDIMGNVHSSLERNRALNLGIVAHMDSVAVQITNILPNGMLQLRHIGIRPHTLLGQAMKIVTRNGIIDGVVGFDPTSQYGQPKGLVEEDLWMDIGAEGYEQARNMVQLGDLAVFVPRYTEMNDIISGTAIDDRIGLFIMDECLNWFIHNNVPINLHFIGTAQEEVGLRGASVIAANTHLDACVILDVDYATDTPTPHENQMGSLRMGKGVGLHVKSDNNPVIRRICMEVAEREGIAYQVSLGRYMYGGTDGTSLQTQQGGIAILNLNIPCRYMHSPIEMCHRRDVESAVQLLIALINELAKQKANSFIPGID